MNKTTTPISHVLGELKRSAEALGFTLEGIALGAEGMTEEQMANQLADMLQIDCNFYQSPAAPRAEHTKLYGVPIKFVSTF